LAKDLENDLENSNLFKGTPIYMSPEYLSNKELTFGVDIWALGCTIYELITNKPLFYENISPMQIMLKISNLKETPKLPTNISKDLSNFLKKCLAVDIKNRPNSVTLLKEDFIKVEILDDNNSNHSIIDIEKEEETNFSFNCEYSSTRNIISKIDSSKNQKKSDKKEIIDLIINDESEREFDSNEFESDDENSFNDICMIDDDYDD
jgi:serine/threonine protein kinase